MTQNSHIIIYTATISHFTQCNTNSNSVPVAIIALSAVSSTPESSFRNNEQQQYGLYGVNTKAPATAPYFPLQDYEAEIQFRECFALQKQSNS